MKKFPPIPPLGALLTEWHVGTTYQTDVEKLALVVKVAATCGRRVTVSGCGEQLYFRLLPLENHT